MKNYPFITTRIQWKVSFCFSWLSSSSDVCLKSFVQLGLLNCRTVDDLKEVAAFAASTRTARVVETSAKKLVRAKGVSAAFGAVLKAGGTSTLDTFAELADRYGADIQEGQTLRADFSQEASVERAWQDFMRRAWPDRMRSRSLARTLSRPNSLSVTATETAALGFFLQ